MEQVIRPLEAGLVMAFKKFEDAKNHSANLYSDGYVRIIEANQLGVGRSFLKHFPMSKKLHRHRFVVLLFDGEKNQIGIVSKPNNKAKGCRKLSWNSTNICYVSMIKFFNHFEVHPKAGWYKAAWDSEKKMLVVDLNKRKEE